MKILNLETWQMVMLLIPILINFGAMWHAFNNKDIGPTEKLAWIGFAVFIPVIGGFAYIVKALVLKKKKGITQEVNHE